MPKITELPTAASALTTDILPIVQDGVTKSATVAQVAANAPAHSGDVTGPHVATVVAKVNGATVPASGALTTGNVLQVSGSAALSYGPVNLAAGSNVVTGALPMANGGTGRTAITGSGVVCTTSGAINSSATTGSNGTYLRMSAGVPAFTSISASEVTTLPGSSGQYLFNSSGAIGAKSIPASDVGTLPGADTQVFFRDGAVWGASANLTFNKTTGVVTASGAVALGSSVASTGLLRLNVSSSVAAPVIRAAIDGAGNNNVLNYDQAGAVGWDFCNLSQNSRFSGARIILDYGGSNGLSIRSSNTQRIAITDAEGARVGLPLGGFAVGAGAPNVMMRFKLISTTAGTTNNAVINSSTNQNECPILVVTNTAVTGVVFEYPATAGGFLVFRNQNDSAITVRATGQSGVSVAGNRTAILFADGTDWRRATADAVH